MGSVGSVQRAKFKGIVTVTRVAGLLYPGFVLYVGRANEVLIKIKVYEQLKKINYNGKRVLTK